MLADVCDLSAADAASAAAQAEQQVSQQVSQQKQLAFLWHRSIKGCENSEPKLTRFPPSGVSGAEATPGEFLSRVDVRTVRGLGRGYHYRNHLRAQTLV